MKLAELIADGLTLPETLKRLDIRGLTADSRAVKPGYLFAAIPGTKADGRRFANDAIDAGAAAVLTLKGSELSGVPAGKVIGVDNPRRALARMAARFYGAQPETVAAVTGTNGKTSVALFTQQIWTRLGHKAASLGTLGLRAPGRKPSSGLTTPDPVALHRDLAEIAREGVTHLALEASSHGLDQYRLDGIRISAAAFTNLSRDHLDYHPTMEAYRDAKLRLFRELLPEDGTAVLNADSGDFAHFNAACQDRGIAVIPYGSKAGDGLVLKELKAEPTGLAMSFSASGRMHAVHVPLYGTFQGENLLCALGLVQATGGDVAATVDTLPELDGVPGRMQKVAEFKGAPIFVDYAHTPGALETVLAAIRPHVRERLAVVFGAGGDRDPGKRPMMGAAAARLADIAYVTDDNPRSEDPASIRAAILADCPGGIEVDGRRNAIERAVAGLADGDALVIAGKGHEQGQIVGDTTHPFDDAHVAREAVASLGGGA